MIMQYFVKTPLYMGCFCNYDLFEKAVWAKNSGRRPRSAGNIAIFTKQKYRKKKRRGFYLGAVNSAGIPFISLIRPDVVGQTKQVIDARVIKQ
jgi:hypothetical protein